jgi:hypothetical protein
MTFRKSIPFLVSLFVISSSGAQNTYMIVLSNSNANNRNVLSNVSLPNYLNVNSNASPIQVQQRATPPLNKASANQLNKPVVNKTAVQQVKHAQVQARVQAPAPPPQAAQQVVQTQQIYLMNDVNTAMLSNLNNAFDNNLPVQQQMNPVQSDQGGVGSTASSSPSSKSFSMPSLKLRMPALPVSSKKTGVSSSHHFSPKLKSFCQREETKFRKSLAHTPKVKVNYELCFSWK